MRILFKREIPVRHKVDIFVAGGGPAGVSAAVAAARMGKSVFLAEATGCFGGMGGAGNVPTIAPFSDGKCIVVGGIGLEILKRLREAKGTGPEDNPKKFKWIVYKPEILKRIYDEIVVESKVHFNFFTILIDVLQEEKVVNTAVLSSKSGLFAVRAKFFIDATGDGDLAVMAGASYKKGDERGNLMAATLCSQWVGINWSRFYEFCHTDLQGRSVEDRLKEAFKKGIFTYPDLHLPGMSRSGKDIGGGNIGHIFGVDGTDEESLTKAMIWGRKLLLEYECFYKEYLEGFEQMELVSTGSLLGVRETRRIIGDYVLNLNDFKRRASFPDEIGRYSYPVDIHPSAPNETEYKKFRKQLSELRYKPGESYGIPYRCLLPLGLKNVFVAGRCISSDRYIQSSVRVVPACYITGEAVGTAAALCAKGSVMPRQLNLKNLRTTLQNNGVYLP